MVTLREAINLIKPGHQLIYLRPISGFHYDGEWMEQKEIREKLDMRAIKVHEISPCFSGFDFLGMELVVSGWEPKHG